MKKVTPATFDCAQQPADDITFTVREEQDAVHVEMDLAGTAGFQAIILNRANAQSLRDWLNEVLA